MLFKRICRFVYNEVVYNGHLQTWGVLAIVILSGQLLNIKTSWDLLLIVYILFYLIYLNDRYQGVDIDSLTNNERSQHVRKIHRYIPAILVIGLVALAVLLYAFSNVYALAFVTVIAVGGFLYPLYFKDFTKKVLAFKNFYVASVFSLMVVLPNLYYRILLNEKTVALILLLASFVFLRGTMMQFLLDLKDIESDKREGLLTLGIVLGKEKTFTLIAIMNVFTSLILPVSYFIFPSLLPASILFLALSAPLDIFFISLVKKGGSTGFILESGEFIYWAVLIYVGRLLI